MIDNDWKVNYGCNGFNGPNCQFTSDASGAIRFQVEAQSNPPKLTTDHVYTQIDVNIGCDNPYRGKTVRAVGLWNDHVISDPRNVMKLNQATCEYSLVVTGLEPDAKYDWKVIIDPNMFFGCNDQAICDSLTDLEGRVRYIFRPKTNQLAVDYEFDESTTLPSITTTTTPATTTTTAGVQPTTTSGPLVTANPVKPCTGSCPVCGDNRFSKKLLRATGDWAKDAGSSVIWAANEPLGLLTYDQNFCKYAVVVVGLKPNFSYKWKATVDNSFAENYGNLLKTFLVIKSLIYFL